MQTNASMHPCPYCDIKKTNLMAKGDIRTIKSITESYNTWCKKTNHDLKKAKYYGKVYSGYVHVQDMF